jgi:hypothetical protein
MMTGPLQGARNAGFHVVNANDAYIVSSATLNSAAPYNLGETGVTRSEVVIVPGVPSLTELWRAAGDFEVVDVDLGWDDAALAAARTSLDESGLLLLGEVHGVRENPLIVRALLRDLGLTSLALEWEPDTARQVDALLAADPALEVRSGSDRSLALWFGDGRVTAGHLAVLRDLRSSGPLRLITFVDAITGWLNADGEVVWDAQQVEREMADRVLAGTGLRRPTLVVAGNAHTSTVANEFGAPMGVHLRAVRPGVRDIRIHYGGGRFYSRESQEFENAEPPPGEPSGPGIRLRDDDGALVLHLPTGTEATVPHRPD